MRRITSIVVHHSVTPRDLPMSNYIQSFDRTHKKRGLHPEPNQLGYHIAYHYIINGHGNIGHTRGIDEIGYHSGNKAINASSIGVCLTGNFDNEKPTEIQLTALKILLIKLKKVTGKVKIIGHRDINGVKKTCPGKNIDAKIMTELKAIMSDHTKILDEMIKEHSAGYEKADEKIKEYQDQIEKFESLKKSLHIRNETLRALRDGQTS